MPFGAFPNGLGSGTLASIYAFGLGDDPTTDNLFGMPSGNLRFPGALSSLDGAAVEYFQDRSVISLASAPAYDLISIVSNLSGIGGGGQGFFRIAELNDPAWNGTWAGFGPSDVRWAMESITFSNDVTQGAHRTSAQFARRDYRNVGLSPFTFPNIDPTLNAMCVDLMLYNNKDLTENLVERLSGFGGREQLLVSTSNGANAQWLTHWNNEAAAPAAGDGPAWFIGRLPFGGNLPRAVSQAYQRGANQETDGWGWRFYGQVPGSGPTDLILDINTDGGTLNGADLTTDYISAKLDLTTALGVVDLVPPRAGFVFVPILVKILTTDIAGAVTTGPSIFFFTGGQQIGATTNAPTPTQFVRGSFTSFTPTTQNTGQFFTQNKSFQVQCAVAATGTGGFAWKAVFITTGTWVPLP